MPVVYRKVLLFRILLIFDNVVSLVEQQPLSSHTVTEEVEPGIDSTSIPSVISPVDQIYLRKWKWQFQYNCQCHLLPWDLI